MRVCLDCYPCFLRQTLEAARMVTGDERFHRELLQQVLARLQHLPAGMSPPQMGQVIHRLIRVHTGDADPYRDLKCEHNRKALDLLPELRARVLREPDPMLAACKLAIGGNQIDYGALSGAFDLEQIAREALAAELTIDGYAALREAVHAARSVLYLGDNAGEIVFDRLLVEEINRRTEARVAFAVRSRPVLNDATAEDAVLVGLDLFADIVANGSDAPATLLEECSPQLRAAFRDADLVIAKGQGNYESLSEQQRPIFFLLKAKCPVVARDLSVPAGSAVLLAAGRQDSGSAAVPLA